MESKCCLHEPPEKDLQLGHGSLLISAAVLVKYMNNEFFITQRYVDNYFTKLLIISLADHKLVISLKYIINKQLERLTVSFLSWNLAPVSMSKVTLVI